MSGKLSKTYNQEEIPVVWGMNGWQERGTGQDSSQSLVPSLLGNVKRDQYSEGRNNEGWVICDQLNMEKKK